MNEGTPRRYGVKEQIPTTDETSRHLERLILKGFTLVEGGYSLDEQTAFADAFDRALQIQIEQHGGLEAMRRIDEHNTLRAALTIDPLFVKLACNPKILAIAECIFHGTAASGAFILNQQNGIRNPQNGEGYNQGAWHRDLPYQHFVSSRPLAINALYCIDPFTLENGATLVARGTHRQEALPSDEILAELAEPVPAPAGSFLVLDCMLFHSGGVNQTDRHRRAMNHVYTLPFLRQQIDLATAIGNPASLSPEATKLFGFGNESVPNVTSYYQRRARRL
jgi:ectoine hydroxylase-related dioxygenase (phytanoyl-CoA dioxygenase family)